MDVGTVNVNGQVTLPAKERKWYGFKRGTPVKFVRTDDGLLLQKAKVVKESIFDELSRLADAKGITRRDVVRICREVGKEVYEEEFGSH